MNKEEFINTVFGKPWVNRSCTLDAMDCWALVVLYYRLVHGINIHHTDDYGNGSDFATCYHSEVDFWQRHEHPVPGGIFVAYRGAVPVHVGLVIDDHTIFHAREKTSVRFDKLRTLQRLSTKVEYLTYASDTCPTNAGSTTADGHCSGRNKPL
ncbi:C40 family peptidase [Salmonella enterica]|nr:C40 family peptidase [Salmonella enterica]